MSAIEKYARTVHKDWGMLPVIPFGSPISIGDVGKLSGEDHWEPVTTLKDQLDCKPDGLRTQPSNDDVWDSKSGRDVQIKVYAQGETSELVPQVANAHARAEITLGNSESF